MKKWMLFVPVLVLLLSTFAYADEVPVIGIPSHVTLKQGFIVPWDNPSSGFQNMTTTTILQTKEADGLGNWNAIWEGWSLDAAWAYDANTSNLGLMLGRHFGTLAKYLPLDYPWADKVDVTIYPVGILVTSPFDEPSVSGATGAGIIKLSVEF